MSRKNPVQLTSYKALTEQTDTLQSPSSSADGHQSAAQCVRKSSTDSGTGTESNHSNHSHQGTASPATHESVNTRSSSTQAPDTEGQEEVIDSNECSLININQSLADIKAILESIMKILKLQVQSQMQRESHSLSGSSSDITSNQPLIRANTESKTCEQRKLEIKEKQEVKVRSKSEPPRSDTILEDNLEVPGDHSSSQPRDQDADQPKSSGESSKEEELRSRVKDNLPTFIRQTDWTFLLPYLVSVDLSDSVATDYLLSESKSHQEKGVHFYLRVLPSKGPDAYTRFHRCLCNEKEHLGHQSLQQLLQSCDK